MLFIFLAIAILIITLNILFISPKFKGMIGERKVRKKIGKTKENSQYVFNDVLLNIDNKSSQIDHIVLNQNGVFVIETKNYSGRIYGSDNQFEWTQVLQHGKEKNKFYNPVKQNQTHIFELRKIIGNNVPIESIIVFVQGNIEYINSNYVCSLKSIKKIINSPILDNNLSLAEMKRIYNLILTFDKRSISTKDEHKNKIFQMQKNINNNICPRCGGNLVMRRSKYGEFYGCENFPKCTFTKKYIK